MVLSHINSYDDVVDSLEVMRMQEETCYYANCNGGGGEQDVYQLRSMMHNPQHADLECRQKMADWMIQVVDFCNFSRSTVAIALNYLDRYLQTCDGIAGPRVSRKLFQLAAMTCLYTAVKIHEPEAMEPKTIAGLSRGAYQISDVEAMERSILASLQYRVNPPTAQTFLHHFLDLFPTDISLSYLEHQMEIAQVNLVGVKASTMAFCALANATDCTHILEQIRSVCKIDMREAIAVQDAMWQCLQTSRLAPRGSSSDEEAVVATVQVREGFTSKAATSVSQGISPRCVTTTTTTQ